MLGGRLFSQQRISRLLTLLVTGIIGASGCLPITPLPPPVQDESLVTTKPCLPPCWYGIYPGQTTLEEAIEIVKGLSFVDPDSVARSTRSLTRGNDEAVNWRYIGARDEIHGGRMEARQGTVVWLWVSLPRKLKLADVLVTQGKPDLVDVVPNPEITIYHFRFFYERGLVIRGSRGYAGSKGGRERATLSPDIAINEAEYFAPRDLVSYLIEMQGHSEEAAREIADFYQPWPGLGQEIPVP